MGFVVESGAGLTNANSYVSELEFVSYFTDRNNAQASELSGPDLQGLLVTATTYVDVRFGQRFKGCVAYPEQALAFPRYGIGYDDQVPVKLKQAVCEYAWRAANGEDLGGDVKFDSSGRLPTKIVKKVGPIDKEITYASRGDQARPLSWKPYTVPDAMIAPFLLQNSGMVIR